MIDSQKGRTQQIMANQDKVLRGPRFIRGHAAFVAVLSILIVVPCFWQRRLEAGDLPSHIYNAWLAQLVQRGRAPGLYIAWRWNNVLFDLLLFYSAKLCGFAIGSKIVVAVCVLVFFWGVFSFVTAVSGRPPWFLAPCLAMLAYGYTFNMGFFNYYLSVGLACFGLALLWKPSSWDWLAGVIFFALATLAHPIGSLWFLGTLAYQMLRKKFVGTAGLAIPVMAIGIFVAAHWYFVHVAKFEIDWLDRPFYLFNGLDQLIVYSARYCFIAAATLAMFVIWIAQEWFRGSDRTVLAKPFLRAAELYLVCFCATSLLPQDMRPRLDSAWIGVLVSRLTLISAVFGLCAFSCLRPMKWVLVAGLGSATAFFALLYQDTIRLNRLESHAEALAATLPFGTRVIPTLLPAVDSRIPFIGHIVDRACIGHCFTYSNYEPASRQFRLRAEPGSLVATASAADAQEMEAGEYVVKAADLPLKNIYQCDPGDYTVLCVRDMMAGETTGSAGENEKE
jgi:hypothetical protein